MVLPDPRLVKVDRGRKVSQCTYRCVVLPDSEVLREWAQVNESQCTYRCVVLPDAIVLLVAVLRSGLNAPTGAWCSLTRRPDAAAEQRQHVSMHLQVRGAP